MMEMFWMPDECEPRIDSRADLAGSDMPPSRPVRCRIRVATGSDVGTWSGETTRTYEDCDDRCMEQSTWIIGNNSPRPNYLAALEALEAATNNIGAIRAFGTLDG